MPSEGSTSLKVIRHDFEREAAELRTKLEAADRTIRTVAFDTALAITEAFATLVRQPGITPGDAWLWQVLWVQQGLAEREVEWTLIALAAAMGIRDKSTAGERLKRLTEKRVTSTTANETGSVIVARWPPDVLMTSNALADMPVLVSPPSQAVFPFSDLAGGSEVLGVSDENTQRSIVVGREALGKSEENTQHLVAVQEPVLGVSDENYERWLRQLMAEPRAPRPKKAAPTVADFFNEPVVKSIQAKLDAAPTGEALGVSGENTQRSRATTTDLHTCKSESVKDSDLHTYVPPTTGGPEKGPPPRAGDKPTTKSESKPQIIALAEDIYRRIGDDSLHRWIAISLAIYAKTNADAVESLIAKAASDGACDNARRRFKAAGLDWITRAQVKGRLKNHFHVTWQDRWDTSREAEKDGNSPQSHRRVRGKPRAN
jgi:hypothetical protein